MCDATAGIDANFWTHINRQTDGGKVKCCVDLDDKTEIKGIKKSIKKELKVLHMESLNFTPTKIQKLGASLGRMPQSTGAWCP